MPKALEKKEPRKKPVVDASLCELPPVDPIHASRFERICHAALLKNRSEPDAGIGTLKERRLHSIVKHYLCDNEAYHEVGVENTRYVADVRIGNLVYEVQTGAFYPMQRKIGYYLEKTDCTVTVVHPIAAVKWISWVDPATHEIAPRKRSPKKGRPIDLLPELYSFLPYLSNPRLRYYLLLLEVEDFRLLNGRRSKDRKRGSERYERIPLSLLGELEINEPAEFAHIVPRELPGVFTVREFSALTGLVGRDAYSAVRVLSALGFFREGEKRGRAMTWERVDLKD